MMNAKGGHSFNTRLSEREIRCYQCQPTQASTVQYCLVSYAQVKPLKKPL